MAVRSGVPDDQTRRPLDTWRSIDLEPPDARVGAPPHPTPWRSCAMSSPVRRFVVLATLLALMLGVSGAAAPTTLAAKDTSTRVAGIDVDTTTIPELQDLMDSHRLSSVKLVRFYLHRIAQLNPALHAVITVSPTALVEAKAADRARRKGVDKPLLGIPVIVKDNINTTGMPTTAGSWALAGNTPDDAFIVERLEAAGAIVIAKANLSEWANFRSDPSSAAGAGSAARRTWPMSSTG